MDKQQIEAHRECILWFIENPSKGVWFKPQEQENWLLTTSPVFSYDIPYLQNDEYTELRRALYDGKVIEKFRCHTASSAVWDEVTTIDEDYTTNSYRIKSEEPKFKVGDWIVADNGTTYQYQDYLAHIKSLIKWTPTAGEWCVFWNDKHLHYTIGQYTHTQHGNDFIKAGDLSHYNNIAPLEFAMTFKDK